MSMGIFNGWNRQQLLLAKNLDLDKSGSNKTNMHQDLIEDINVIYSTKPA